MKIDSLSGRSYAPLSVEPKLDVWSENVVQSLERWADSALKEQWAVPGGDREAQSVITGAATAVHIALAQFR